VHCFVYPAHCGLDDTVCCNVVLYFCPARVTSRSVSCVWEVKGSVFCYGQWLNCRYKSAWSCGCSNWVLRVLVLFSGSKDTPLALLAERYKVLVWGARQLRMCVRIPPGVWKIVCCECCVLSGRDLCDGLITRPEESYRLWWFVECDLENFWMRRHWPTGGLLRQIKKKMTLQIWQRVP
jgi:hypothetical protein